MMERESMMRFSPRRIQLLVLTAALCAPLQTARPQSADEIAAARKALLVEVVELMRGRILPVMRQWKEQFDTQITPRDRGTLEALRERYGMLHDNIRNNLRARQAPWDKRDYRGFLSIRGLLQTNYQDRQKIVGDAARVADRNGRPFTQLVSRIDSAAEDWRGAAMGMFVDWFTRHRGVISPAMNTPHREELARLMATCKNIGLDQLQERAKATFLLWDGEDFSSGIFQTGLPESPLFDGTPESDRVIFIEPASPNPFVEGTQIRFLLTEPGPTIVRVLNTQGREIRVLLREELPVGKHLATFDAAGLPSGQYYVLVESRTAFDAISIRLNR